MPYFSSLTFNGRSLPMNQSPVMENAKTETQSPKQRYAENTLEFEENFKLLSGQDEQLLSFPQLRVG